MIDPAFPAASWFLWVAPILFAVVYALPIFLTPLGWARWFTWDTPARDDLAVYFGRCTGALGLALCAACLHAAPHPAANRALFDVIAIAGGLLVIVHIRGAIEKRQPFIETLEIGLYAVLTGVAIWLRP